MKKNEIKLNAEQRKKMEEFSKKGVHSVRLVNRAKIILSLDTSEGRKTARQEEIAERVGVSRQVVNNYGFKLAWDIGRTYRQNGCKSTALCVTIVTIVCSNMLSLL